MSIDITAPEVQEAIKAAVEEQVSGLKAKNAELIGEVKKLRQGKQIDPADIERLESEIETLKNQNAEAVKTVKAAQKEAETARKALESAEGFTQRLLVDNGLNDALAKAGITNPVHIKAVKAMLGGSVKIEADGDNRVAKIGDKALSDYVAEWAKGDEGKFFVAAPANNGGGATGSSSSGGQKIVSRATFDQMGHFERSQFAKEGGKVTE